MNERPQRAPRIAGALAAALAVGALTMAAPPGHAQDNTKFMRDCYQWVERKGYSVDYIEQRTGQRPAGNLASNWVSNLEPAEVQPGDVVFMYTGEGRGQRAEVVDEVLRQPDGAIRAFRTSSMNMGRMVEPVCNITEGFGKVTRRTVDFARVIRAWRPEKK